MELAPVVSDTNRIAPIGHALLHLVAAVAVATSIEVKPGLAVPAPQAIKASGGLQFQSQGGGTPNVFSGSLFAPLAQRAGTARYCFLISLQVSTLVGP